MAPSASSKDMITHVVQLRKDLAAATTGSRTEEIKTILRQLKKDVVASESLIRDTKIGLSVGKLRQNANKEIADLAKEIVRKWKQDVGPVRSQSGSKSEGQSPAVNSNESQTPTSTPASAAISPNTSTTTPAAGNDNNTPSQQQSGRSSISTGNTPLKSTTTTTTTTNGATKRTTPRNSKSDKVEFNFTEDYTRNKCMSLIYDALASDSDAPNEIIIERSKEIESEVDTTLGANSANYTKKMRSLYVNLKDKKNPGLRESIISGQLTASKLVNMSPQEMASAERKEQDQKIAQDNLFKAQAAKPTGTVTDIFKCGKCQQRKCTYFQMQTRSADEPMTTFVTCLICDNRWKFS